MYRVLLKRELRLHQWMALFLLFLSCLLNAVAATRGQDGKEDKQAHISVTGLALMTVYCLNSGFAGITTWVRCWLNIPGVATEKLLKRNKSRSLFAQGTFGFCTFVPSKVLKVCA